VLVSGVGVDGIKIATGTLHKQQIINKPEQPIAVFTKRFCFENHAELCCTVFIAHLHFPVFLKGRANYISLKHSVYPPQRVAMYRI